MIIKAANFVRRVVRGRAVYFAYLEYCKIGTEF